MMEIAVGLPVSTLTANVRNIPRKKINNPIKIARFDLELNDERNIEKTVIDKNDKTQNTQRYIPFEFSKRTIETAATKVALTKLNM
jgi:hypothetical protein